MPVFHRELLTRKALCAIHNGDMNHTQRVQMNTISMIPSEMMSMMEMMRMMPLGEDTVCV